MSITAEKNGTAAALAGILLCVLAAGPPEATGSEVATSTGTAPAPAYKLFRYDEDYRYLKDTASRADSWDPIKYIPIDGTESFVSLGGEVRERFEDYTAADFGVPGRSADSYLLHRVLVHADLHLDEHARAFVQLASHRAFGKNSAAPPYSDRLDVQQAFFDWQFDGAGDSKVPFVRIGRQEMAFGAQRLVAVRDAPNVRRAFDGIRFSGAVDQTRYDVFATRPVLLQEGNFDDKSNSAQEFWGVYTTSPISLIPDSAVDIYYLGFDNRRAVYAIGTGSEKRHSIGARVFGHAGKWDWDWEALGQVGTFAQKDIRAWGFALDTGYTFPHAPWTTRGGFKITVGSGNSDPNGATLRSYGPLFPKIAYFNQAGLIGASNVIDLQPSLVFKPAPALTVTAACDFIWRQTIRDAVFTSPGPPIPGTAGRHGRHSGNEPSLDVTWRANRHVLINGGFVHVTVARVLADLGGHDTDFLYLSAAYSY
ncbi:alginate export family protein [Massilia terrae]|uniref:Alginate export family protein n=1 Tax=Massilia terrae TaxID=1811224 RepID=A0ABT2CRP2_9BURK|nr:alginate export family protein [Massilia terrae]MCS0656638.1 alginate export family protein [Massilia terrae]